MRQWLLPLLSTALLAQDPGFTVRESIQAEWSRSLPSMGLDALPSGDRTRYELSLARIGAPGTPELLPGELGHPTQEVWEARAREARTPETRFTALLFLNRLKDPRALLALDGIGAEDAKTWPTHLHLEGQIAAARLNGAEVSPALQGFLKALEKAGKVDPVRAQAAQLRLVLAGKEKELRSPVPTTPGSVLSMMDAFNRAPAEARLKLIREAGKPLTNLLPLLGLKPSKNSSLLPLLAQRITEGDAEGIPLEWGLAATASPIPSIRQSGLGFVGKLGPSALPFATSRAKGPLFEAAFLPSLRMLDPKAADKLRQRLLEGPSAIARAAALDDFPTAPPDLDDLAARCRKDSDLESALEFIQALDRWKLSPERQKALLSPFLQHPDWGWRYQAWLQLRKTDPTAPWPTAPPERPMDKALLTEALRLAERAKPVFLRITFNGNRSVTLKLDPTVAPMNVANLVILARKHFFDGHRVPRVVPDFVVQMGSPLDTMDGGPGYSVRCEDSLQWYGPGSVGMALAGKDTGGCQFFITTNATPHLTGKYTRMGELADMDHDLKVLDDLELGAEIVSIRVVNRD